MKQRLLAGGFCLLALVGCSTSDPITDAAQSLDSAEEPAASTTASTADQPSSTEMAEATPIPTVTPTPSATSVPTPTATPQPVVVFERPLPTASPADLVAFEPDAAVVRGELDNGLRYLIAANDSPGLSAEFRLVVDAGSAQEADGQEGAAHMVEHLMFNGTEAWPGNTLIAELEALGVSFGPDINAFTSYDETVYQLGVRSTEDAMTRALDILVQWAGHALIEPDAVEDERGVVLSEWRERRLGPSGRLTAFLEATLLGDTVYADRSPIATEEAILGIETSELRRFYDDWYRPDRMTIVAVGDFDPVFIEDRITSTFASLSSRGANPDGGREPLLSLPALEVTTVTDPELTFAFAEVLFPGGSRPMDTQQNLNRSLRENAALQVVEVRLTDQITRGELPPGSIYRADRTFVAGSEITGVGVRGDADEIDVLLRAVMEEFERIRRFGVTDVEAEQVVAALTTQVQRDRDALSTRQDADYAAELVAFALTGNSVRVSTERFDATSQSVEALTADTITAQMQRLLSERPPAVLLMAPADNVRNLPDRADIERLYAQTRAGDLVERAPAAPIPEALMEQLEEVGTGVTTNVVTELDVTRLSYANGATVVLKPTRIVTDTVLFTALGPGGLSVIDDQDVERLRLISSVAESSGVGPHDRATVDAILRDDSVSVGLFFSFEVDAMTGRASTGDLEEAMQYMHLLMTDPRADEQALANLDARIRPTLEDPTTSPGFALRQEIANVRFGDDPRFRSSELSALDALMVDDIALVEERLADAGDFTWVFVGDFDVDAATTLASRYIGTLEGADEREVTDYSLIPAPPGGVVRRTVEAGESDQGSLTLQFTEPSPGLGHETALLEVLAEAVSIMVRDELRERLSASYSPTIDVDHEFADEAFMVGSVDVAADPDRLDELEAVTVELLGRVADEGVPAEVFDAAFEIVSQRYDFISNEHWLDELENEAVIDGYIVASPRERQRRLSLVNPSGLNEMASTLFDTTNYISVQLVPESSAP